MDTFLVALNPRNGIPELYSKAIAREHAGATNDSKDVNDDLLHSQTITELATSSVWHRGANLSINA